MPCVEQNIIKLFMSTSSASEDVEKFDGLAVEKFDRLEVEKLEGLEVEKYSVEFLFMVSKYPKSYKISEVSMVDTGSF